MKIEEQNILIEKARTKNNGIYSYKGNYYLVYKNRLHSFCDYFGQVFECAGAFNASRGKAKDRFEGRDVLKKYLAQLKGAL